MDEPAETYGQQISAGFQKAKTTVQAFSKGSSNPQGETINTQSARGPSALSDRNITEEQKIEKSTTPEPKEKKKLTKKLGDYFKSDKRWFNKSKTPDKK